jgi:S-formylglutathione hydrolase
MAYKHPNTFPVVAAIGPAIDYQMRIEEGDHILTHMYRDVEDARQDTATLHIHPLNWPRQQWFCGDPTDQRWFDSVDRLRMKLYSLGIPFDCDLQTRSPESQADHAIHPEARCITPPWGYYQRMAAPAIGFLAAALEKERLRVE